MEAVDPPELEPPELDPPELAPTKLDPPKPDPPDLVPPEPDPPELDPPEADPPELAPTKLDPPKPDPPEPPRADPPALAPLELAPSELDPPVLDPPEPAPPKLAPPELAPSELDPPEFIPVMPALELDPPELDREPSKPDAPPEFPEDPALASGLKLVSPLELPHVAKASSKEETIRMEPKGATDEATFMVLLGVRTGEDKSRIHEVWGLHPCRIGRILFSRLQCLLGEACPPTPDPAASRQASFDATFGLRWPNARGDSQLNPRMTNGPCWPRPTPTTSRRWSARLPSSSSRRPSVATCYQEPFVAGASGLIAPETIAAPFVYIDRFHGQDQPRPILTSLIELTARAGRRLQSGSPATLRKAWRYTGSM
jgi:hypothetical protein